MGSRTPRLLLAVLLLGACAAPPTLQSTPSMRCVSIAVHAQKTMPFETGDAARGRQAFIDLQCHACHRIAEDETLPRFEGAWEGPVLQGLGRQSPEAVAWKIVTRTSLAPESIFESPMLETASMMTEQQLIDLVVYLRNPPASKRQ